MPVSLTIASSKMMLLLTVGVALPPTRIPVRPDAAPLKPIMFPLAVPPPPEKVIPTEVVVMVLPLRVGVPPLTVMPCPAVMVLLLSAGVPLCTRIPVAPPPMPIVQLVTVAVPLATTACELLPDAFTVQNCNVPAAPDA
jgi:hypothetical protein